MRVSWEIAGRSGDRDIYAEIVNGSKTGRCIIADADADRLTEARVVLNDYAHLDVDLLELLAIRADSRGDEYAARTLRRLRNRSGDTHAAS